MISIEQLNRVGDRIFLNPTPLLTYEKLAKCSLGSNTYRGFHRLDKDRPGASSVFRKVLNDNKNVILNQVKTAKSERDLNILLKQVCKILLCELKINTRADQLTSFNKIRKPMDIVIEHMVAMGKDFTVARTAMINWLFLPLDSQIFQSKFVFSDQEARSLNIKRRFTFKDIKDENHYADIQAFLNEKAVNIGINHRIYFDLIWNERYKSDGTNLFLTNPR